MSMTSEEIRQALEEAAPAVEGAFVQKILQTGAEEWNMELRNATERLWLAISVSPRAGRVHLCRDAPLETIPMEGFARNLKKSLLRRKVLNISQINADRVAQIRFGGGGGEMTLAVEIMGTAGNLYLLDHDGKVGAIALSRKSRNQPGEIYSPPPARPDASSPRPPDPVAANPRDRFPYNFAMDRKFEAAATAERLASAKARATAPIREELKKLDRHGKNLREELASLQGYSQCRQLGDLIMANHHAIAKGVEKLETANLFSPDMEQIVIPLDPAKSPDKNAEVYYKKARKLEKGAPRITAELAAMEARRGPLAARLAQAQNAMAISDLAQFLPQEEEMEKRPSRKPQAKKEKQATGPKTFVSSEGYTILVGRNDRENDELTFKTANGRDLWLHARDYPGSHVLVRMPKGVAPSDKTIREGAMIALHYSKAAKAGKGEVTYCLAKEVKKPKGAPPGKALVHGAKSVMVKIDEAAIKGMKGE